jgi:uncharacterized protein YjlB
VPKPIVSDGLKRLTFGFKNDRLVRTIRCRSWALKAIQQVRLPKSDPVMGADGPLPDLWKRH